MNQQGKAKFVMIDEGTFKGLLRFHRDTEETSYSEVIRFIVDTLEPNLKMGDIVWYRGRDYDGRNRERGIIEVYPFIYDGYGELITLRNDIPQEFTVPLPFAPDHWILDLPQSEEEQSFADYLGRNVFLSLPGLGEITRGQVYEARAGDQELAVFPIKVGQRVLYFAHKAKYTYDENTENFIMTLNVARETPTLVKVRKAVDKDGRSLVPVGIPANDFFLLKTEFIL